MIKNLLNADEEIASRSDETAVETAVQTIEEPPPTAPLTSEPQLLLSEPSKPFEIPEGTLFFKVEPTENPSNDETRAEEIPPIEELNVPDENSLPLAEISNADEIVQPAVEEIPPTVSFSTETVEEEKKSDDWGAVETPPAIEFKPPSKAETIRRSGLAWSAGVIFFGSVVFMLILGWFADLLLGSSPWGLVGGIVLGALIGFIQFFRITSQIFKD